MEWALNGEQDILGCEVVGNIFGDLFGAGRKWLADG